MKAEPPELPLETMELQMGPSHPATHGTIKFNLTLAGEKIIEALAVVFAGGIEKAGSEGMATYREMMTDFMGTYLGYCSWLGVKRNLEMIPPFLTQFVKPV